MHHVKIEPLQFYFFHGHEPMRRCFTHAGLELNAYIRLHFVKADIWAFFAVMKDFILLV